MTWQLGERKGPLCPTAQERLSCAGSVAALNTHQSRTRSGVWHLSGAVAGTAGRPEAARAAQPPSLVLCSAEGDVRRALHRGPGPLTPLAQHSNSCCKLLTSQARCLPLPDQSKLSGLASLPPPFLGPMDSCSADLSPWSCQEIQGWSL